MRWILNHALAVGIISILAAAAAAQQPPQAESKDAYRSLQVQIVRINTDRIRARTDDLRDVFLVLTPRTRIVVNGKLARLADLPGGALVNVLYRIEADQMVVRQIEPANPADPDAIRFVSLPNDVDSFRGRVTKITSSEQFVAKASTGETIEFAMQPTSRLMLGDKEVAFDLLKVGSEVNVVYTETKDNRIVDTVVLIPNPTDGPVLKEISGEVVRTIGNEEIVLRTADKEIVTIIVGTGTQYSAENRPSRFLDLVPSQTIRVRTEVENRRHYGIAVEVLSNPK